METSPNLKSHADIADAQLTVEQAVHAALLATLQNTPIPAEVSAYLDLNKAAAQRVALNLIGKAGMGETHTQWLENSQIYL